MSRRPVRLSEESLTPVQISEHWETVQSGLRQLYQYPRRWLRERFADETPTALHENLAEQLTEAEREVSLTLLASIEAALRVDFLERVYQKKKDPLSRACRNLHKDKGARASLEDKILPLWREFCSVSPLPIGELRGAFKYRHWLAHGRYWVARLGRRYDFDSIYILADAVIASLQANSQKPGA